MCINKADFLSDELILHWNTYFKELGVHHVFISALKEQFKLDNEEEFYDSSSDEEEDFKEEEEAEFEPLFGDLKKEIDHDLERREKAAEER